MTTTCLLTAWQAHEGELRGWLRRRMPSTSDADDMLQDLFLRALRQRDRFCSVVNARAWLFTVARNAIADKLRLQRHLVELPDDLQAETSVESASVGALTACLPRVLSELSAIDREAVTLCDLEGLSQADFARRVGLTLAGAKARVQRARKRLRQQLTEACQVRFDQAGNVSDFVPRPPLAFACDLDQRAEPTQHRGDRH
jgi:RNA polymerase sigma-70 factor, ECF subfamily